MNTRTLQAYLNRIAKLENNGKENQAIVKKLKRKVRQLKRLEQ